MSFRIFANHLNVKSAAPFKNAGIFAGRRSSELKKETENKSCHLLSPAEITYHHLVAAYFAELCTKCHSNSC